MLKKVLIAFVVIGLYAGSLYVIKNEKPNTSDKPTVSSSNNGSKSSNGSSLFKSNIKPSSDAKKAVDFKLKDLSGKEVSLSDYKGKNVYLNFWASWCPPCRGEMPDIEKLYQKTKDSNLVILAVNLGEDQETVAQFMKNNHYNFKALLDIDQIAANIYNINAIPDSYFIDKNGNIVSYKVGAMTYEEMLEGVSQLSE